MSLFEVMIAMVIALTALVATALSIDSSRHANNKSEYRAAAGHVAEKELERIQSLPYGSVLLDSAPATSTDANDPGYYVTPGSPQTYRWDQRTGSSESPEPLAIASGATCLPAPCLEATPTSWSDGRLSGKVYRYVTWVDDTVCGSLCPGSSDFKRVTVAVTEDADANRPPVLTSVAVTDPTARRGY